MENKETHDLIISAFGPSECRICHRMGSQVVAFPCTQVEDLSSERQTSRELAQTATSTDIDRQIDEILETAISSSWNQAGNQMANFANHGRAKQQLKALLAQATVAARIDELDKLWGVASVGKDNPSDKAMFVEVVSMLKVAKRKGELQSLQRPEAKS